MRFSVDCFSMLTRTTLATALGLVFLALTLPVSAHAASYQQIDGTVIDPILLRNGGLHSYSGNNLEPFADLFGALLLDADLTRAWLPYADLRLAILAYADCPTRT